MKNSFKINDVEKMLGFGARLAQVLRPGDIIYLRGELGAGKTTLVRGFLQGLGYVGKVKSPTYTIVEQYNLLDKLIYHFDLYRLEGITELELIGIRDYFSQEAICLLEWPEKGVDILPTPDILCEIALSDNGATRVVTIIPQSVRGETISRELCEIMQLL